MMLKCTFEGKTIGFSFEHVHGVGEAVGLKAMTICRLQVSDDNLLEMYSAQAFCSAGDRFTKNAGRKLSLARALFAAQLPRAARCEVWERYFNRDLTNAEYARWVETGSTQPEGESIEENTDNSVG